MIEYANYDSDERTSNDFVMPEKVKLIEVSYYGGRLSITINDEEVYENMAAGNDFNVVIV